MAPFLEYMCLVVCSCVPLAPALAIIKIAGFLRLQFDSNTQKSISLEIFHDLYMKELIFSIVSNRPHILISYTFNVCRFAEKPSNLTCRSGIHGMCHVCGAFLFRISAWVLDGTFSEIWFRDASFLLPKRIPSLTGNKRENV
jgi:hypothetical protein